MEKTNGKLHRRVLRSGPGHREVKLETEDLTSDAGDLTHALIRNELTLIDSSHDLGLMERSVQEQAWHTLGRLAIGRVERAAATGPAQGDLVYWHGPHADLALMHPERLIWVPVPAAEPLLMPAGVGAEAQLGVDRALADLGEVPEVSVVLGQGMLGHLAAQWLRYRGSRVAVVDNSPKRLEFSKYAGLAQRVDTHNIDWLERLKKMVPGGTMLLVDASGSPKAVQSLMPILKPGSVLCRLGPWRSKPLTDATRDHMRAQGGRIGEVAPALGEAPEHREMLENWIKLIHEGAIPTERIITHRIEPEEGPKAMKRFATGIRSWLGAVICWGGVEPEK